ncbi:MAG: ABC transporter ATP-binding protein [Lachnospiraceae bacterium]|nr:ABC transporter ATP-binding protein [Lachnospiraceae bacterium]
MEENRLILSHVNIPLEEIDFLQDISFTIEENSMTAILGANGCGKTTLLRAICNQIPFTGQCEWNNISLQNCSARELSRLLSYIPQRSGITISMSVLDVVLMGFNPVLKLLETPSKLQKEAASKALSMVGLTDFISRDYLTLSEGEKQLCILARTLVTHTKLWLLDEPDSSLDFHNRYHMLSLIKQMMHQSDACALLCLHDPGLALNFCDQLILLKEHHVAAILHPRTDPLPLMEKSLSAIYGSVTLKQITDNKRNVHLVLLSEQLP